MDEMLASLSISHQLNSQPPCLCWACSHDPAFYDAPMPRMAAHLAIKAANPAEVRDFVESFKTYYCFPLFHASKYTTGPRIGRGVLFTVSALGAVIGAVATAFWKKLTGG